MTLESHELVKIEHEAFWDHRQALDDDTDVYTYELAEEATKAAEVMHKKGGHKFTKEHLDRYECYHIAAIVIGKAVEEEIIVEGSEQEYTNPFRVTRMWLPFYPTEKPTLCKSSDEVKKLVTALVENDGRPEEDLLGVKVTAYMARSEFFPNVVYIMTDELQGHPCELPLLYRLGLQRRTDTAYRKQGGKGFMRINGTTPIYDGPNTVQLIQAKIYAGDAGFSKSQHKFCLGKFQLLFPGWLEKDAFAGRCFAKRKDIQDLGGPSHASKRQRVVVEDQTHQATLESVALILRNKMKDVDAHPAYEVATHFLDTLESRLGVKETNRALESYEELSGKALVSVFGDATSRLNIAQSIAKDAGTRRDLLV